ncbi:cullin-4A [Trichonephila clavipes]|nr:cullin-4A [Trichonephila clavipes]
MSSFELDELGCPRITDESWQRENDGGAVPNTLAAITKSCRSLSQCVGHAEDSGAMWKVSPRSVSREKWRPHPFLKLLFKSFHFSLFIKNFLKKCGRQFFSPKCILNGDNIYDLVRNPLPQHGSEFMDSVTESRIRTSSSNGFVASVSRISLNTAEEPPCIGCRCYLNVKAQTSSRWMVVVWNLEGLPRGGLGSNPGEGKNVCKCIVPSRHGGTLNSRRAASPFVRLVAGDERWKALTLPQGVLPQNWGETELYHTVSCMVLKANDRHTSSPLP